MKSIYALSVAFMCIININGCMHTPYEPYYVGQYQGGYHQADTFAPEAERSVSKTMGITGCPPGTKPDDRSIQINTDASVYERNGYMETYREVHGSGSHKCAPTK